MKRILFTFLLSILTISLFAPIIHRDLRAEQKAYFAMKMSLSALLLMRCFSYVESGWSKDKSHEENQKCYYKMGLSGDYGKYQIIPGTWRALCNEFFGHWVPMTPGNQDFLVRAKMIQWLQAGLTHLQIAALWNCGMIDYTQIKGEGIGKNSKGVPYDVPGYIKKIDNAYLTLTK
jgi:hypothetical protein